MNKKLSLLFFFCFFSALSIYAEVYSGSCGTNVKYILDTSTGVLSITGTGTMTNYSPSSSAPWSSKSSYIESIEISDGVISIGNRAFEGCVGPKSLTIGNSVTAIGEYAFEGCSFLTSVHIKDITAWCKISFSGSYSNPFCYAKRLFMDGKEITDLVIPNSVTKIKDYAFYGCSGLTSVIIPKSVTSIGSDAFRGCFGLTLLTIDNGVTTIGSYSFSNCKGLTSLIIPNSVTSIGNNAFSSCSGLTSIEIPNSVTTIDSRAFSGCSGLTSLTIPNSVTSIGSDAFSNCSNLTSLTIPNSVTTIGSGAFVNCSSLINVDINSNAIISKNYESSLRIIFGAQVKEYILGNSVTSIGNGVFWNCSSLTSVTIPNSVTSIGGGAFSGCSGLTSIEIPNSVTSIGNNAFYNCKGLTSLTIGNGMTTIGEEAFRDCSGLTSLTIPNSVTSIGNNAFYNCEGLTSLTIGNGVTTIGAYAFYNCKGLTSLTIPNSVTSIGSSAFYNCSGLTSLTIGNSVSAIGGYAFKGCYVEKNKFINNSSLDAETKNYWGANIIESKDNGFVINVNGTLIKYEGNETSITVPSSVTSIGENAFRNCSGLTSIEIPSSVTTIDSRAFSGCSGLTSIEIPNSVTLIGSGAFSGCSCLTSIEIPSSVTSIGNSAFYGCSGLTSIEIPNSVTSIENGAFYNCSSLTSVTIPNSVTSIGNSAFYNCKDLTSIEIPNNVTLIGSSAFYGCSSLTSVIIPNSVTSIGDRAFNDYDKSSLIKVDINSNAVLSRNYEYNSSLRNIFGAQVKEYILGNSVTTIGTCAFSGCSGLTKVTIPNSVTTIGSGAFSGCSNLTEVTIPNNVIEIGNNAFSNCSNLAKVKINSNSIISKAYSSDSTIGNIFNSQVKEYILGEDIAAIGDYAFYNCYTITSVTIPDNVISIGSYAFDGTAWYNNLPNGLFYAGKVAYNYKGTMPDNTSIIIKEGTVKLNANLFEGCTGLSTLYIPGSVKSIGNNAFANCSELLDVYCYIRKPLTVGENAFDNSGIQFATLHVPKASLNGYKVTEPWSGFGNIQTLSGEYPEMPEITKCATPIIIFESGKLSFCCETEGVRYVYNFSTPSESDESGSNISKPDKLLVSVYATKECFENSDIVTKEIDLSVISSGIKGDVNEDGIVNGTDIQEVINIIVNDEE